MNWSTATTPDGLDETTPSPESPILCRVTAPTDSDPPIIFNSKQEGWYKTVHNLVTNMLVTNMRYPVVQNCTQLSNKYAVPGGTKLYTT